MKTRFQTRIHHNKRLHRHPSGSNILICVENFNPSRGMFRKSEFEEKIPLFGETYVVRDCILLYELRERLEPNSSKIFTREVLGIRLDGFTLKSNLFEEEETIPGRCFLPDTTKSRRWIKDVFRVDIDNKEELFHFRKKLESNPNRFWPVKHDKKPYDT